MNLSVPLVETDRMLCGTKRSADSLNLGTAPTPLSSDPNFSDNYVTIQTQLLVRTIFPLNFWNICHRKNFDQKSASHSSPCKKKKINFKEYFPVVRSLRKILRNSRPTTDRIPMLGDSHSLRRARTYNHKLLHGICLTIVSDLVRSD